MEEIGAFMEKMLKPSAIQPKARPRDDSKSMESPRSHLKPKAKCVSQNDDYEDAEDKLTEKEEARKDDTDEVDEKEEDFQEEQEEEIQAKDADHVEDELTEKEEACGSNGLDDQDDAGDNEEPPADDPDDLADEEADEEEPHQMVDDQPEEEDNENDGMKKIHQDEHDEDETERAKLRKFVDTEYNKQEMEHEKTWDQHGNWKHRNKKNWSGQGYGYNKGNGYHDWRWNKSGKGKGWGKRGKWQKWSWNGYEDGDSQRNDRGVASDGSGLLTPDSKGKGFYLPGQQGFLDKNGKYHPPGGGLVDKSRVRGGAKAQQAKRKAAKDQEEAEARKHQRLMMERLAALAEKALDKV